MLRLEIRFNNNRETKLKRPAEEFVAQQQLAWRRQHTWFPSLDQKQGGITGQRASCCYSNGRSMTDLFKDLDPVFNSNYIFLKMYVKLLGFKKKIIKISTETYISISINFVVI